MSDSSDFLQQARERFSAAQEDEAELRKEALASLKMVAGEQWDPVLKAEREKAGRPAESFNRLGAFVQQVSNEARQNKAQSKFSPVEDADEDTAEVYEGLARHIQYTSDAAIAYETAIEYSAGGSFGYWRYLTDFCDDDTDDQELKVVPVLDPFAVYGILVPACYGRKPRYAFVIEDMPKAEYKLLYPNSKMMEIGWQNAGSEAKGWVGTDTVRIAEYWYAEDTVIKGKKRNRIQTTVKVCKMNGVEKLPDTETKWVGSTIPIIPVLGKQVMLEGKPKLLSLVSSQLGAQKLLNYAKNRIAETLATAPISPWIAIEGQTEAFAKEWAESNVRLTPVLRYKAMSPGGTPAPPPQRQTFEPPIAALSEFISQEVEDLKATTGMYDASIGNHRSDESGVLNKLRQQQANITVMHFMDNLERSFKMGGEVIAEAIPKIYDAARTIRILGEDETPKIVKINQEYQDEKTGEKKSFFLNKGKYDLVVTVGRSFSTKKMESFDMISQLIGGNPDLIMWFGDIFFKNSDTAGADQMAERAKKMLQMMHPGLIDDDEQQPIPPQAQQAIQQAQQQVQALNAHAQQVEGELRKLQDERDAKVVDNQAKMTIAQMNIDKDILIAEINTKFQETKLRMEMEHEVWQMANGNAHELGMQNQKTSDAAGMQAQKTQQAGALAQQKHGHTMQQNEQKGQQAMEQQSQAGQQQADLQQQAAELQPTQ